MWGLNVWVANRYAPSNLEEKMFWRWLSPSRSALWDNHFFIGALVRTESQPPVKITSTNVQDPTGDMAR